MSGADQVLGSECPFGCDLTRYGTHAEDCELAIDVAVNGAYLEWVGQARDRLASLLPVNVGSDPKTAALLGVPVGIFVDTLTVAQAAALADEIEAGRAAAAERLAEQDLIHDVPPALLDALATFDATDPIMGALGVLDVKLAVVIADQERLIRLLERVAGVVDVRLVTP